MNRPALIRLLFVTLALLAATGCASSKGKSSPLADAVTTPLGDLNLVRAEIPQVLLDAMKNPYAVAPEASCEDLRVEVSKLDAVLGPDLDAPLADGDKPGVVKQGAVMVENAALDAVRGTTGSLIPFRGWIRRLSGAERHSQQVAAAVMAGTVHRAYLKGVLATRTCT